MDKKIFFTSDTHYNHKNICRSTSSWDDNRNKGNGQSTRDFTALEEMNKAIIEGINNKVSEDDELWHLGDWSFGGINNIWEFRKQIKCKNINLVFGNHDHHIENNAVLPNVISDKPYSSNFIDGKRDDWGIEWKGDGEYPNYVEAQRLFSSVQYVKELKVGSNSFFLSHYAHRVWSKSHHGKIHLYGHSHSSLEHDEWGKSMDVGIDNYFRLYERYEPFSLQEITNIMTTREHKLVDHHNSNTN